MGEVNETSPDDYPKTITILSTGSAATKHSSRMGVYTRLSNVTQNDGPVWKLENKKYFLLYTGAMWMVSNNYHYNYTNRLGYIQSMLTEVNNIPARNWTIMSKKLIYL